MDHPCRLLRPTCLARLTVSPFIVVGGVFPVGSFPREDLLRYLVNDALDPVKLGRRLPLWK